MAMKSSAGYDLTSLFVGSEGTLGVFTEIVLRLYPIPENAVAARAVFPAIEAAGRAAVAMVHSSIQIGRVELVDARTVEGLGLAEAGELLGAPPTHLVRCFTRRHGLPPHRYLTGRRLETPPGWMRTC